MKGIYFISGIDTNIGKSIATGWLAGQLLNQNVKVITQKLVQTGNKEYSEDIELHRKIMKINISPQIGLFHYTTLFFVCLYMSERLTKKNWILMQ